MFEGGIHWINFMANIGLSLTEIHGFRPELGLRVFTDEALGRQKTGTAMGGMKVATSVTPAAPARTIPSKNKKGK